MSSNLIKRIIVAVISIPIILYASLQGGVWLFILLSFFVALGIGEYLIGEGVRPTTPFFWSSWITTMFAFVAISGFWPKFEDASSSFVVGGFALFCFFMLSGMLATLMRQEPAHLFNRYVRVLWGMAYVGVLYGLVYRLGENREDYDGGKAMLFLFAILWIGDTAAMWVGSKLGKHKLAPTVSPNKTVEGFVGGFVSALLTALVFYSLDIFPAISFLHLIGIACGVSIFGQLGDMVESMWKRSVNLKDSSHIIPGHGGILDRFDSLLFAAPFAYLYFLLVSG